MFSLLSKLISVLVLLLMINMALAMSDPMRPPAYRGTLAAANKATKPRWVLSSTLISQHRRLATVNGKTLLVGEKISGAKLLEIQPALVTLKYQGQKITIKLLPSVLKRQRMNSME